ncbi:MAG TPA: 2-C-methyl-D-erythritol 2,4-cyclodiphosphate synthase [Candidatus Limnocylindria bacterium]|nr:2-C-methyl-D-erythritol 2,4-cyclodiphosphate synthase [Candidatus Limnocylindria bacterium]
MSPLAAVLVAAGRSRRMGSDKLWLDLFGRPVWRWSLDTLLASDPLERLALVVPSGSEERFRSLLPSSALDRCLLVPGGPTRGDSVRAGLAALTDAGCADSTLVLVHDAARPAASGALIARVVDAAGDAGGVVPGLPVSDTLMRESGEHVDRQGLVAVQTPQLGRLGDLRSALGAGSFTDEGSALAAAGLPVRIVAGEPGNRKMTEPDDLELLRAVLRGRALPVEAPSSGARVGIGFDAHRLEAGRPLRLGGLDWPDAPRGLAGHSDGDAALHALIDALLGAAGLGDIGAHFPADDAWRDADSADLLRRAAALVRDAGWMPSSVDLVIVAAGPAIAPRREEMAGRIGALLGVPAEAVGVKGTTSDGLGLPGGEGIAAYAMASIVRA